MGALGRNAVAAAAGVATSATVGAAALFAVTRGGDEDGANIGAGIAMLASGVGAIGTVGTVGAVTALKLLR